MKKKYEQRKNEPWIPKAGIPELELMVLMNVMN